MTVCTIALNATFIPLFGAIGAAFGSVASSTLVSAYGVWRLTRPDSVIHFEPGMDRRPDFTVIRSLFRFGLPTGVQGIAMNIGGVFLLRFIGSLEHSAAAQAAFAVAVAGSLGAAEGQVHRVNQRPQGHLNHRQVSRRAGDWVGGCRALGWQGWLQSRGHGGHGFRRA